MKNPQNSRRQRIVLNNYAYYLSVKGVELEKLRTCQKAVILDPENSSFQDTYGWVSSCRENTRMPRNGSVKRSKIKRTSSEVLTPMATCNSSLEIHRKRSNTGKRQSKRRRIEMWKKRSRRKSISMNGQKKSRSAIRKKFKLKDQGSKLKDQGSKLKAQGSKFNFQIFKSQISNQQSAN